MPRIRHGMPGIYNATPLTLTDAEGSALAVNSSGVLITAPQSGTFVDEAAFTEGTTDVTPIAGYYKSSNDTLTTGQAAAIALDVNRNVRVVEQYAPGYEDNTIGVAKVEQRYSYGRVTADGQIKASAGFVHTITISPTTATPTAGLLTLYDSAAESGTAVFSEWFFATDQAHTIILDVTMATGIYVGYDATLANVSCTVSYR